MKEHVDILTLKETEELCRLYMDCQLSVLEEKELQYILGKVSYTSPAIEEAREAMIAEGLLIAKPLSSPLRPRKKRWIFRTIGFAASLGLVLTTAIAVHNSEHNSFGFTTGDTVVIAYEDGKQLNEKESEEAVSEAMKKADELIAMADAKQREAEEMQRYFEQLK